ncbi:MAG: acyl-CoA thioesterase, partial [Deltaproteobacteria bacterium]|nr:acyl-CoA thioesterase [Deltaproteobacteria bacterium]
IRGYHLDFYSHVNNARYLEFLEEGRWEFFSDFLNTDLYKKVDWQIVIVNININFRGPVKLGDTLVIETGLKKISKKSFTLIQRCILKENDAVAADALVKMVAVHKRLQKAVIVDEEVKKLLFGNRRIYASE